MWRKHLMCVPLRVNRGPHAGIRGAAAGLTAPAARGEMQCRYVSTTANSTSTSTAVGASNEPKTMDQLGGPSFITTVYGLLFKGYLTKGHLMQNEHRKIYGPMWKSTYGPLVVVNLARADLIEQVLRQEGKTPLRFHMQSWRLYRETRNKAQGPLTEMGPEWLRIRTILNPRLLKPKHVASYHNSINEVVTDFIHRVDLLRAESGQGVMVNDLASELYKFSCEAIASVLFETRLGCLNKTVPEETQKFIDYVGRMFQLSLFITLFPKFTWPYLTFWKQFVVVWDHLFKFAEDLVQKQMERIQDKVNKDQSLEGAYLTHLLCNDQMTLQQIVGSITDVMLAGVDTTSNTISWILYELASKPEIQEKLYQEVMSVCPGDKMTTSDEVARMPLLKAIVKETLRLYPVVPGNSRVNFDREVEVGGYTFAKNTLFHLCHYSVSRDEENFPDPNTFNPQRWLRGEEMSKHHPFSSVPYGFGTRACLGRRLADLEMFLLVTRLIKRFELRPDPTGTTVNPTVRTLLCPASPINLQFLKR